MKAIQNMTRREIRYNCYRLRTETEGVSEAEVSDEFKEFFEQQYWFLGWPEFAVSWDVSKDGMEVVPRKHSESAEWHSRLAEVAEDFPS